MENAKLVLEGQSMCDRLMVGSPNLATNSYDVWYCDKHREALPNQMIGMMYCGQYERTKACFIEIGKEKVDGEDKPKQQKPSQVVVSDAVAHKQMSYEEKKSYLASVREKNAKYKGLVLAGDRTICCLKNDGTVLFDGDDDHRRKYNVSSWRGVVSLTYGNDAIFGIKADGNVVACGNKDSFGARLRVSGFNDIVEVVSGYYTIGLKSDGTVVIAGDNYTDEEEVKKWSNIVALAIDHFNAVGIKSDGTVVATGDNRDGECNVSGWSNIIKVAVSRCHGIVNYSKDTIGVTYGLKKDGTVEAIGKSYGLWAVGGWKDIVDIAIDISFDGSKMNY